MRLASLDRPILITGTPRSGKTLVRIMLECAGEFSVRIEPSPTWQAGGLRRPDDRLTGADATPRIRRRIQRDCQRALARSGKRRYADELAHHMLRLLFVQAVMPEARIVHVIRHPQEAIPEMAFWWGHTHVVATSTVKRIREVSPLALPRLAFRFIRNEISVRRHGRPAAWGPNVPGLQEFSLSHGPAEIAAFQWQVLTETALADAEQLAPDRVLEARKELLGRADPDELRRLADFCEVEDRSGFVREAPRVIIPDHPVFARVEPSPQEWDAIWERIAPTANRLGYTRDPHRVGQTILPKTWS